MSSTHHVKEMTIMAGIPPQGWALTRLLQLHKGIRADVELLGRVGAAVDAIADVAQHLTAHLDEEEQRLGPALNAVSRIVPEHQVPPPPPEHLHGVSGLAG
jgi:hypothetical protein